MWCGLQRMYFIFFFQAEDGIRDLYVTGVQTCALPICPARRDRDGLRPGRAAEHVRRDAAARRLEGGRRPDARDDPRRGRSEERRVGKECRSRWWQVY